MPCPRTVLLSAYMDHACTERRRALIGAHVLACPVCAAELSALRQLCGELRGLQDPPLDLGIARQYRPQPAAPRLSAWRLWLGWSPAGLAIAAALAAGLGLGALPPAASPSGSVVWTASLRVFDPVPPGGLCAAGLCNPPKEQT
ncbi:zf-HC2 domain-containing protein [Castellaniella sp. GW247-6E4]|uniref:anti-sigma factor family protein n=1 Tax=Castellaniella sp. GW247-6E4 TaxID=3140380 RepID=UPI0033154EFC